MGILTQTPTGGQKLTERTGKHPPATLPHTLEAAGALEGEVRGDKSLWYREPTSGYSVSGEGQGRGEGD